MPSVAAPRLTPDQITEAVRRYIAGDTLTAIARDAGVTGPSILYHVRRAGVPLRTRPGARRLTSRDPEPPEGSVVENSDGFRWGRLDGPYGGPGRANWLRVGPDGLIDPADGGDAFSWVKVAGNFGPVRLVR